MTGSFIRECEEFTRQQNSWQDAFSEKPNLIAPEFRVNLRAKYLSGATLTNAEAVALNDHLAASAAQLTEI